MKFGRFARAMEGLGSELPVNDTVGDRTLDDEMELSSKIEDVQELEDNTAKLERETKEYVETMEEEGELEDNKDILDETVKEAEYLGTEVNEEAVNIAAIMLTSAQSRLSSRYTKGIHNISLESIEGDTKTKALLLSKNYQDQLDAISVNQEGLLASIVTTIGDVMTSLEKLTRSRKGFIQGMLKDLTRSKIDIEDDAEERFNNKYEKLKAAYMVYIDGDNDLLTYLTNALKILDGGIKLSYNGVPVQKIPSKLSFMEEHVEKDLRSKFSSDDNILPNPDGNNLEYKDYKVTGVYALKGKVVIDYAIKYNRGITYHSYAEVIDGRTKMELSINNGKELAMDALRNIDQVANIIKRLKESSIKVAKLYAEADRAESKWYRKIFLKKNEKYKAVVNNYYELVETYCKFIVRNLAKQDNLEKEAKTAEIAGKVTSTVSKGVKSVANRIMGNSNSYDY